MKTEIRKVTLYIQAEKFRCDSVYSIKVNTFQCESSEFFTVVNIGSVEVEVEIPEIDENKLMFSEIEILKKSAEKEKADSFVRLSVIENKIQQLRCIEHKEVEA